MINEPIKVYARLNENKVVIAINSNFFLDDTTDYICIDEWKVGLPRYKYAHAQGNYLEKGLTDEQGRYNYKFDNGLVELTDEEKEVLFPAQSNEDVPTIDERVEALESAMLEMILGGM